MSLENSDSKSVSEHLAEMTDRPAEEFEPDFEEYPIPDLDDLESVDPDKIYDQ